VSARPTFCAFFDIDLEARAEIDTAGKCAASIVKNISFLTLAGEAAAAAAARCAKCENDGGRDDVAGRQRLYHGTRCQNRTSHASNHAAQELKEARVEAARLRSEVSALSDRLAAAR